MTLLIFLACSASAFAGDSETALDGASAEALEKTKAVLTDPAQRAEAVGDPSNPAAAADRNLKSLGLSPEAREQAYKISAEILEKWVHESGGDVGAMKEKAGTAQRDPASFAKELSPAQLEQIRKMGREIEGGRPAPN